MSDERAEKICADIFKGDGGVRWSPADIMSALESMLYRVRRVESSTGIDDLRRRLKTAEEQNSRLLHIETEDAKKAGRANGIYFEIETMALVHVAGDVKTSAIDTLKRIHKIAREERLGQTPASASADVLQPDRLKEVVS